MLVLVALSTLLKLTILLCESDHVSPDWVLPEELHRGNIAQEILDGPLLALQDYHHAPNVGGSLVVGIAAVPFIALFGPSIVSVRLVPVLFNALTVALLFLVLDRFVNRRAAWIGGLLIAIAPPGYSLISVTAWGTHLENNAQTMACLYLFLSLRAEVDASRMTDTRSGLRAFAFGALAGFATYFGYMFLIALLAMLFFEFLHDKLFVLRPWFRAFVLGFAIGIVPWVTYNRTHDFGGLSVYNESLADHIAPSRVLPAASANFVELVSRFLPSSFFFRDFPHVADPSVVEWSFYLALAVLVAIAAWSARDSIARAFAALFRRRGATPPLAPAVCFLIYVIAFAGAFSMFDFQQAEAGFAIAHDGRHVAPLYPFLVMLAAIGLDFIARHGSIARVAAGSITAILCATCLVGTLAICDFDRFGASLHEPGTSEEELARFIAWRYKADVPRLERLLAKLDTSRPERVRDGMIFCLAENLKWALLRLDPADAYKHATRQRFEDALHFLHEHVDARYKPYCEDPIPGERLYAYGEHAEFWADYNRRRAAAGLPAFVPSSSHQKPNQL